MSALSALLVRDRVVSPQKIDEALQRQVIDGGDFETVLLEMAVVEEDTLASYCAAAVGADPIGRDEIRAASLDAVARVPRSVAESQRVVPVGFDPATGRLRVAAAAPLDEATSALLAKLAGATLELRITTPFRLQWALWKFYGADMPMRLERLARRLDATLSGTLGAVRSSVGVISRPAPSLAPQGAPRRLASALAALSAAITEERESEVPIAPEPAPTPAEAARVSTPPPPERATLESLRDRLADVLDRDAIVAALLDYARTRAVYVALFAVRGDVAEGLDARGPGLDGDSVRRLAVPLDAPGVFRSVRDRGLAAIGDVSGTRTDRVIKEDLGRPAAAHVALLPVHLGGRVVLIAWADNGIGPLEADAVAELTDGVREAARAFERLIADRKRRTTAQATRPGSQPPPPSVAPDPASQRPRAMVSADPGERAASLPPAPHAPIPARRPTRRPQSIAPIEREESSGGRDTIETPAPDDPFASSTRFARGGRVPIAVDIVGPLPEPGIVQTPEPASMRSIRARDPRREPEETPADGRSPAAEETSTLVAEIVRTGTMGDALANRLLGAGDAALTAVFRYFPGPTSFDRTDAQARRMPVGEMGPLLRLAVMFRQVAAPRLIELLDSPNAEQRYFATLVLGEVTHPSALASLLPRLFDPDLPTRSVAVDVLRAYRKFHGFEQTLRHLRALVTEPSHPVERRRIAANALGELRDPEAVPALLYALPDRDAALAGVARRSLVVLARQDFGDDVTAWRAWWERASGKHRIEWLIEALLHDDATIRHESSEELKKVTGQFFGYYFNLPRREREKAHRRYTDWWEREGRSAFAP